MLPIIIYYLFDNKNVYKYGEYGQFFISIVFRVSVMCNYIYPKLKYPTPTPTPTFTQLGFKYATYNYNYVLYIKRNILSLEEIN